MNDAKPPHTPGPDVMPHTADALTLACTDTKLRRLLHLLLTIDLALVVLYGLNLMLGQPSWLLTLLLDLDGEQSIAMWFSSMQLSATGVILLLTSIQPTSRPVPLTRALVFFGLGFLFLSADEALQLHERTWRIARFVFGGPRVKGDWGLWVVVYAALGVPLLVFAMRPMHNWRQRQRTAVNVIVLGFGVIVLGAAGFESIGHLWLHDGALKRLYPLEVAFEEGFEMAGGSLLVYGALLLLYREQAAHYTSASATAG